MPTLLLRERSRPGNTRPFKLCILVTGRSQREKKRHTINERIERKVQATVLKAYEEATAAAVIAADAAMAPVTTPTTPFVNNCVPLVQQVVVQPPGGPVP